MPFWEKHARPAYTYSSTRPIYVKSFLIEEDSEFLDFSVLSIAHGHPRAEKRKKKKKEKKSEREKNRKK